MRSSKLTSENARNGPLGGAHCTEATARNRRESPTLSVPSGLLSDWPGNWKFCQVAEFGARTYNLPFASSQPDGATPTQQEETQQEEE